MARAGTKPTRTVQGGRRRLAVEDRRDELIQAALDLFSKRPSEDVSMDDVADAAGASRALLYHYFGTKRDLHLEALRFAAAELSGVFETPKDLPALQRFGMALVGFFDFVEAHAAGFEALLRGGPAYLDPDVGEIVEGVRQTILDRLLEGLGIGVPTPALRMTLRGWIAATERALLDWLQHHDLDRADVQRLVVDQLGAMLRVATGVDPEVPELLRTVVGHSDSRGS